MSATPMRKRIVDVVVKGRRAKLVIPFDALRLLLTPDGEVALLGHVHHVLRRLMTEGDGYCMDYFFDGDRLELSIPLRYVHPTSHLLEAVVTSTGLFMNLPLVQPTPWLLGGP